MRHSMGSLLSMGSTGILINDLLLYDFHNFFILLVILLLAPGIALTVSGGEEEADTLIVKIDRGPRTYCMLSYFSSKLEQEELKDNLGNWHGHVRHRRGSLLEPVIL